MDGNNSAWKNEPIFFPKQIDKEEYDNFTDGLVAYLKSRDRQLSFQLMSDNLTEKEEGIL